MKTFKLLLVLGFGLVASVFAAPNTQYYQKDEIEDKKDWVEDKVEFPALPQESNLISIYLNATSVNRYWVDANSITVGNDGVVRYSLIVLSGGGVRGVTYEGIRCETRELRRYAVQRQHAVLYLQHFCPDGALVRDAAEAKRNLKRGGRLPGDGPVSY
jgi:CNP1-like family